MGGKHVTDKVIGVPLSGLGEPEFSLAHTFTQTPPAQECLQAPRLSQMFARYLQIIFLYAWNCFPN